VGTPPFTPALRDKPIENGGKGIPLPAAGTPFDPESRLYARSAGDDKAPILAMMTAIDALRASGLTTRSNIKFAFEGEEEANSANLEKIFTAHRKELAADLWLVCDGPVHQTRRQSIVFGARGISAVDVTVYGPRVELHSGHYGNWAPNPAMLLVRLLASMKDDGGRVLVDHDKDATFAHIVDHVRTQGFFVVDAEPSADVRRAHAKVARVTMRPGGYNSVRTSMDLPISQEIIRTVERARRRGEDPEHGGRRAARHLRAGPRRTGHRHPHRESRRQPAQRRREHPDTEPLGRHRAHDGAADNVGLNASAAVLGVQGVLAVQAVLRHTALPSSR
jgi:acetylornithine deacetylase/succinyl-diaminopimelate desuccinylase-like protein